MAGTHRGEPVVEPLFRFRSRVGAEGRFEATGTAPALAEVLRERGEAIDDAMFAFGEDEA